MIRPAARDFYDPAILTVLLVLAFTAANAIFNAIAAACGLGHPYITFLPDPSDLLGDFFKVVRSYGDGSANAGGGLDLPRIAEPIEGGYDPKAALATIGTRPHITHFHLMPLSTLVAVLVLAASRTIALAWIFAGLCAALLIYVARIASLAGRTRSGSARWLALALLSYPMLMMWTRGNLLAGLTCLLIVHALLLALLGRAPIVAALALTLAVEIRPNAAFFAVPLLAMLWPARRAVVLTGAIAGTAIALGSLFLAHRAYPAYDLPTFLAGLGRYYLLYVAGDDGLPYGSSLYGAMKLIVGPHAGLDGMATLVALALVTGGLVAFVVGRLARTSFLFLVCAGYCLGSAVFADYHLLVFLIVPMAAVIDNEQIDPSGKGSRALLPALLASAAVLAPKNYVFADRISAQVLINPLLLLAAGLIVLNAARRAPPTKKGGPSPDRPFLSRSPPVRG